MYDYFTWLLVFKDKFKFGPCKKAISLTIVKVEKMQIKFPKPDGTLSEFITAIFKDSAGNPTTAHGTVTYASSDTAIATVAAEPDGVSATVTGTGLAGTCTITGTDEKDNISDVATVTTAAGEAMSMALVDADPVPAPAPTPAPAPADPSPALAPADPAATTT